MTKSENKGDQGDTRIDSHSLCPRWGRRIKRFKKEAHKKTRKQHGKNVDGFGSQNKTKEGKQKEAEQA